MIDAPASSLLVAAVALSMLLTPLLLVAADRWWIPLLAGAGAADDGRGAERAAGRAGDHRRLRPLRPDRRPHAVRQRHPPTVLDHDAEQIEALRRFGWRVYYGDATRLDLLRTAGAGTARVLVVAIDDIEQSVEVATLVREHFPHADDRRPRAQRAALLRAARARREADRARDARLGADERAQRARAAGLAAAPGAQRWRCAFAATTSSSWRRWRRTARTRRSLIAVAKQGRQQLEELFARERRAGGRAPGPRRLERRHGTAGGRVASAPSSFSPAVRRSGRPRRTTAAGCARTASSGRRGRGCR